MEEECEPVKPHEKRITRNNPGVEAADHYASSEEDGDDYTLQISENVPVDTGFVQENDVILELNEATVRMRDRGQVETIIRNMQREGASALQVISDFHMTLTRFAHEGKRCPTTHSILHNTNLISEECKAKVNNRQRS
ncbi:hypothetical protein KOW79_011660 [Hemibagrus wyckioides]|uniref:PDZ domain-containing protein n=1 Tax=Hemibagrus wyckioides TaxID=337641 RepID=A0A9D3NN23_9TELE|nr:hypothetical protein KOW79_011660 [Hemibagrus wyckioides]